MDDLLWHSKRKIDYGVAKPRTKEKRSWVVRIPSTFVFTGAKTGGFQTIVIAETRDQAWEEASKSEEWEILDFFISHMKVFPKEPI